MSRGKIRLLPLLVVSLVLVLSGLAIDKAGRINNPWFNEAHSQQSLGSPTVVPDCLNYPVYVRPAAPSSQQFGGPYYESYAGKYVKPDANGVYLLDDCAAIKGALTSGLFEIANPKIVIATATPGALSPGACYTPVATALDPLLYAATGTLTVTSQTYMGPSFEVHAVATPTSSPTGYTTYNAQVYVCNHTGATATPTPSGWIVKAGS